MKVVLFCGGMGTRLRDYSSDIPKPLVPIGQHPIILHVMRYYAHFGHKDFILCLGYMADKIKDFFLRYQGAMINDFTMANGGKSISLINDHSSDWNITFIDTGIRSNIGTRLMQVKEFIGDDEYFLANYTDGLTDMPLAPQIEAFRKTGKVAAFMCSRPSQTFHVVTFGEDASIKEIKFVKDCDIWINSGFFIFRRDIFEYMKPGEDLVMEPFNRLLAEDQLVAYKYEPFWAMDTFKEQQELTDMVLQGRAPWQVWLPALEAQSP